MIYLLLTVLLNTILFLFFKLFPKYNIDTFQAIVVNYATCVVTGSLFLGKFPVGSESVTALWFPWSLLMGCMYISIFNFIAYSTYKFGVTTATVANKLSLVIPVVLSVLLYNEHLSTLNIAGIMLAFPAVYMSISVKDNQTHKHGILLPALLFLFSGGLDALTKWVEHNHLHSVEEQAVFPIHVFAVAATIGIIAISIMVLMKKTVLHYRNLIAGIILGVPNYFSIYYLIRMLNSDDMPSAIAFALNNIGIVVLSAFVAILFMKEKLTKLRLAGLILAIVSIILIAIQ